MRITDERTEEPTRQLVRDALTAAGKSQTEAAVTLGLSQAALSRRLLGHVDFTVVELRKLAAWLGVPVTALVDRPEAVGA